MIDLGSSMRDKSGAERSQKMNEFLHFSSTCFKVV